MQMLKCIELDEKLKSMDQEITVNPQFVQKVPVWASSWIKAFITRLWFQHSFGSVPTFRVWERRRMTSAARRQATLEADGWIAAFPTSPSSSQSWKTFMFFWIWTILEENINVWNDPFFFFLVLSQCTVNKNSFLSVFIYQCLVDMPLHHLWSYEIKIPDISLFKRVVKITFGYLSLLQHHRTK